MKEEDRLVLSKSLAFCISSPIDTFRQNKLTLRKPTVKKILNGICGSFFGAACISFPCYKTIAVCEKFKMHQLLSVTCGVLVANIIKTPIIFNFKRLQIGLKMTSKIPLNSFSQIVKLNLLEDIVDESAKYTMLKYKAHRNAQSTMMMLCVESLLLFSLSYPFDILKNKKIYGNKILNLTRNDFMMKAFHKNFQNILFFSFLKIV